MKKNIELSVEKARELYKTATTEFKKLLEENFTKEELSNKITDRIKSWEEVEKLGNFRYPYCQYITEAERKTVSFAKLKEVIAVLNEGWQPNWGNSNERKYAIYIDHSDGGWVAGCGDWGYRHFSPSGLYLKNEELCKHLIKYFSDLLKEVYS